MHAPWRVSGLEPETPVETALALILRKRFAEMWAYADAGSEPGMDIVHDMRVAARRVQGILRLFKTEFPLAEFRKHDRVISNLIKTLGRVRDFDVNILAVRKFRKTLSAEDGKALSVLMIRDNETRRARVKVLEREIQRLRAVKYEKSALRFFDSVAESTSPAPKPRSARTVSLRERTRNLVPALFNALTEHAVRVIADPSAIEELHDMRLAGKPLRYLMEASAQVFGEPFSECLTEIKAFLDIAGTIHDCDVLTAMLEEFLRTWDATRPRRNSTWSSTSRAGIVKFIRHEKALRRRNFAALERMVTRWREEDFERKLLKSVAFRSVAHGHQSKHGGGKSSLFLAES
jgi:CHAD domain-containing protein